MYEGVKEAPDKFALYKELRKENGAILSVSEVAEKRALSLQMNIDFLTRITTDDKVLLARNLGSMLEAGLALSRALSVLERQLRKKKIKTLLASVNEEIKKGKSLNQSLALYPRVFSNLFIATVKAGEESGSLASSLKILSDQMARTAALVRKIRGAMIYPAIVISVMILIGILMLMFVVPSLTAAFSQMHATLPLSTRIVIFVSNFLRDHTLLGLLAAAAAAAAAYFGFRTAAGRRFFDFSVLHIPIISGLVKESNSARTARTLASLMTAGVPVVEAFKITGEVVQNSYFKAVLEQAGESIQKGSPISAVFAEHEDLYPAFLGEMVAVGEETGKLSEMLRNVSEFYEEEVDRETKDMSTIVEPFLMVIIGAGVGFFAISMISPIYSLVSAV